MQRHYRLDADKIVECGPGEAQVWVYVAPDETERRSLVEEMKLDEHTLASSLDPDELARVEFEPDHTAIIFKRPKSYSSEDNFLFRVGSTGLFLFKDRLIIVTADEVALFEGRPFLRVPSLPYVVLKLLYRVIFHYNQHLRAIHGISDELEQQINMSMENKYLLNMFTLEKSLVYYVSAINSNGALMEKLKLNAGKLGFTAENLEFLDDIIIENNQCYRQAEIYSNVLASLMDARASIVANNLNLLIRTLTVITIVIMLPTLVVSIFSMNVKLPVPQEHPAAFWAVLGLSLGAAGTFWAYWSRRK